MTHLMNAATVRIGLVRYSVGLILLWVGLAAFSPSALALDPKKAITQYVHDVWTSDNGLPQNSIFAIVQTRDGYLWFGTNEGVARFDGIHFTVFDSVNTPGIKHNYVPTLFEDKEGNLWIGTQGGLTRYRAGQFTSYTANDGLAHNTVLSLYQDRAGSLWVGTAGGLSQLKNGKFATYTVKDGLSHNSVSAIYEDRAGHLWVGTRHGLDQFKDGRFIAYPEGNGLSLKKVLSIYEDRAGALWVGTEAGDKPETANRGGLHQLKDGQVISYTTKDGLPPADVTSILEDRQGSLWIGTSGGLSRLQGARFTGYATTGTQSENSRLPLSVRSLYEDGEGSLWVGTGVDGLHRLRDGKFMTYTAADGLSGDNVSSIYEDRAGNLWVVEGGGGLNQFKDGKFVTYTTRDGLSGDEVISIYEDREGSLWIGTARGLNRLQHGRFTSYTAKDGLPSEWVFAVSEDSRGGLWVLTKGGPCQFRDGRCREYTAKEGLGIHEVNFVLRDQAGDVWIGAGDGMGRLRDGKFIDHIRQAGLAGNILSLYEDREGVLWIGTYHGGLFRFQDGRFTRYTVEQGLFDNSVFTILEDAQGNFWMSCNKGVYRTTRQELQAVAAGKIASVKCVAYGTADGMKRRECNGGNLGGWKTRDGRLWFATVRGVAVIDPADFHLNTAPPPVVIEQVTVDSVSLPRQERALLAPGKRSFEFHYVGLSFFAPEKVKYKYKLEGYDSDWVEADTRRVAYYTNIPPGDHKFRVIACNNDGLWNEAGTSFDFRLRPYFYQTYWFYGLCALGLVLAGVGLNTLRVKRALRQEREQARLREAELRAEAAELQARAIEAEHRRKTEELEEARRLQLSMLPRQVPQLPHLEIAAYMKPATEVGGDYYDFHLAADGTLTVAVGDATGHGLKAGTMVTATKGLFNALANAPEITQFLWQVSLALKQMKLRGLYMALTLAKVKDYCLTIGVAGMPPPLVYRAATRTVEEVAIKGIPLGSVSRYSYRQQELSLSPGDTVMLMSDGFAERFNEQGEMLDYAQAKQVFAEIAGSAPQEIIEHFVKIGEAWAGGRPQDDDVTFVVLKVKE